MIADRSAVPRFLAADLISQAEHSPGASILVTWERGLDRPGGARHWRINWPTEPRRPGPRQPGTVRGVVLSATRTRRSDRQPDRARASACLDGRPEAAAAASDQRRRDLSGPLHPGGRGRLRRRAVARAADRRHGALGFGTFGERLPQAVEPDLALARGAARARAGHPASGRQGRTLRPPPERGPAARRRREQGTKP